MKRTPTWMLMFITLGFAVMLIPLAHAQQSPHVGYVYPAGGETGTVCDITIGGQYLDNALSVYCSGTGVTAVVLEHEAPPSQKDQESLRNRRKALAQQVMTNRAPEIMRELLSIDQKLATFMKRRISPALADALPVRMTIAPNAAPGNYDVRVRTPGGLSNPRTFQVGELPEYRKTETIAMDDTQDMIRIIRRPILSQPAAEPSHPPMTITLPTIINGWIPPGGVDRYRFHAKADERLVIVTKARELIPYLADAVPGWFQAAVALYDGQGKELAYDDHYRFHPDPVLSVVTPAEGDYILEIRDALYRGREDFVYRLAIGNLPFVTDIFPLGGTTGTPVTVTVHGWNLDARQTTIARLQPEIEPFSLRSNGRISNRVPFATDPFPECCMQGQHNTCSTAMPVTIPVVVNGRIDSPGTIHVFRMDGVEGQQIVAETYARRLDSPLDSVLKLCDASGRQIAFNDDFEDKSMGLITHYADSYIRTTFPSNGVYYLYLWDAQDKGGPAYGYRLRLRAPQPDFALRVAPSSLSARAGTSVPLTIYALRKDGFDGEVTLSMQDAPAGFKLSTGRITTNQDQTKLTLSVPSTPHEEPLCLHIIGTAKIAGNPVVRPAVPAEDMMQAFAYRHLVPAQDLEVVVTGKPNNNTNAVVKVLTPTPLKIPAGGTTTVQAQIPIGPRIVRLDFELSDPPAGITLQGVPPVRPNTEITIQTDTNKVSTGQKGSLIINVFGMRTPDPESGKPTNQLMRVSFGVLPAIPFEIVKP